jgi:hypothetical protein
LPLPPWIYNFDEPIANITFKGIYDRLINQQLTSLGEAIPSRQRVTKERVARSIAAEFMLASAVIKVVDETEEAEEGEASQDPTPGAELAQARIWNSKHPQPFHTSSQGLPEYSLPSTFGQNFNLAFHPTPFQAGQDGAPEAPNLPAPSYPSSQASISYTSFATGHSETSTRAIVDRLGRLCDLHRPPSGKNPRPTTLLTHWRVGEDPKLYSWRETTAAIEKAQEEAAMSPSERQREWKRRMKLERQKRREEEKWRKLQVITSSQPVVMDSRQLEEGNRARKSKSRSRAMSQSTGRSMSRRTSVPAIDDEAENRDQSGGLGTGQRSAFFRDKQESRAMKPLKKKRKKRTSGF